MAEKKFNLIPKEIPAKTRRSKSSKYAELVTSFLDSGEPSCEVILESTSIGSAYQGFSRVLKHGYDDKVQVSRVNGALYIERL